MGPVLVVWNGPGLCVLECAQYRVVWNGSSTMWYGIGAVGTDDGGLWYIEQLCPVQSHVGGILRSDQWQW